MFYRGRITDTEIVIADAEDDLTFVRSASAEYSALHGEVTIVIEQTGGTDPWTGVE